MISVRMSDSTLYLPYYISALVLLPLVYREYYIALVTVAGKDGPIRNSVLPGHLADLPNYIGLSSR